MRRDTRLWLVLVALATSPAAAAPVVATAQAFGAVGDGKTDDWWAIQRGMDELSSHGGGILSLPATPSDSYVIRQALRMRSNVIVRVEEPQTTVKCMSGYRNPGQRNDPSGADGVYVNRWPLYGCTIFGSLNSAPNIDNLPSFTVDPLRREGLWITLAERRDAEAVEPGDLVLAASAETFRIGDEDFPHWGEMDRVEEVDAALGRVRLRYSPAKGVPIARLKILTPRGKFWERGGGEPSPRESIGVPLWASWRSGVVGGTWIARDEAGHDLPFSSGGGALDCSLKPHAVQAGWGVGYGNLWSHCQISVDRQEIGVTPVELAYLSSDNQVSIGDIVVKGGRRSADWVVNFDEAAHDNAVTIRSLTIESPSIKDVVSIFNAQDNVLKIGTVTGAPIAGAVVSVFAYTYPGAYPATRGNSVTIGRSTVALAGAYVRFGDKAVQNNRVVDSVFSGSTAEAKAALGGGGAAGNVIEHVDLR